jgi:choline dehydrogenase-like flavoprotein
MMTRILLNQDQTRIAGIEYTNSQGEVSRIDCKVLVLACNSIETPRQLLLNRTREFPDGLANRSRQVGRNLTSHFGLTVNGFFPELRNRRTHNDEGTGYYHSLLTGMYWDRPNPKFEGTYQVQCGAGFTPERWAVTNVPGYGKAFKKELREKNWGHAGMNMQGTLLASPRKFIDIDPVRKDRFGLGLVRVHLHYEANDIAMAQDAVNTCEEIIRAGGGEVLSSPGKVTAEKLTIDGNHWVGTASMGRDPKKSVVDTNCRSHDLPNLFLADGSVFPAYPEKNPVLTIVATAWRTAAFIAEEARRGGFS